MPTTPASAHEPWASAHTPISLCSAIPSRPVCAAPPCHAPEKCIFASICSKIHQKACKFRLLFLSLYRQNERFDYPGKFPAREQDFIDTTPFKRATRKGGSFCFLDYFE